jgi:hypothetical protein
MSKLNAKQRAVMIGIIIGVGVLMVGAGLYWWGLRQGVITGQLSTRSQQFLESHPDSLTETTVDFGDGTAFTKDLAIDGACFSAVIPFLSKESPLEERAAQSCTIRLMTQQPTSRLVISARPFEGKLADDPAIQLRRQANFGYKESSISATRYQTVARFDDKETVSVFWLTAGKMMTIAFTGLADTTKIDTDRLISLIDSIVLNSKPIRINTYDASSSTAASAATGL